MKHRQLLLLGQVSQSERPNVVSEGLLLLAAHTERLLDDAKVLSASGRHAGADILAGLASEEAAKIFILLDYARAGLADGKPLIAAKSHFYSHLAHRIYATEYLMSPADYAEVLRFTESLRPSRVLDGPEGFEFEFGNPETSPRELLLYVDLISVEGEARWSDPLQQWTSDSDDLRSAAGDLALAMQRAGLFAPESLTEIARVWKDTAVMPNTHWQHIRALNHEVLASQVTTARRHHEITRTDLDLVLERWGFPLLDIDLRAIKVSDGEISLAKKEAHEAFLRDMYGDQEY